MPRNLTSLALADDYDASVNIKRRAFMKINPWALLLWVVMTPVALAYAQEPPMPGVAPMIATGFPPKTRGISFGGRDSQSMAFLSTPGIE